MIARTLLPAVLAFFVLSCGQSPGGPAPELATLLATVSDGPDSADDRDPQLTPGDLCTRDDSDFDEYRYAERVPHCRRHVTQAQKREVGIAYGVDPADFSRYQFDHFIPLAIGGSNASSNLWPLEYATARRKAAFEQQLYSRISRGEITQREAIAEIHAWR